MYETMAHFLAFEEYYIKKDFQKSELTFDDTDEEMVDLIRFLGNILLKNGVIIYKGFPVHYKSGRSQDADLDECINAVHRLKVTFMHKGEKEEEDKEPTAKVTFDKKKKTIHFVNHYESFHSSFDMDVTIPESLLLRVIKTYFDKRYNVMTTEEILEYLPKHSLYILSRNGKSIFDEETDKILRHYHLDPKKTKIYRNVVALGRGEDNAFHFQNYVKLSQTLLKKLRKLEDKKGYIQVDGENVFDATVICKSEDMNILSIYETKTIIRGMEHIKDKKSCHYQGIADNLGISPMNPCREKIAQLYLELLKVSFKQKYPNLDLSDFHIKANAKAKETLRQFHSFAQGDAKKLEDMYVKIDEKLNGTKTLDDREVPFTIEKMEDSLDSFSSNLSSKYAMFTGDVMHSFRNSLSHIMVNEKGNGLSFYDADSTFEGAPKKCELAGTLDSFDSLKEALLNPDLTDYVAPLNLAFFKNYFYLYQQYYMQVEEKSEIEATMKALEKEKTIAILMDKLRKQLCQLHERERKSYKKLEKRP